MKKKILVISEICIDGWFLGDATRLSPEGPFAVFVPDSSYSNYGMGGNVVECLKAANPDLEIEFIHQQNPIKKTRYVDKTSNYTLIRVDEDDVCPPLSKDVISNIIQNIEQKLYSAVIISDYSKGLVDEKTIESILYYCDQNNIPSFLDTKKVLGLFSLLATVVKINKKEWNQVLDFRRKYKLELESMVAQNLVVTLGADGCDFWEKNKPKVTIPTRRVDVSCQAGLGDTVLAYLVVKYLETRNLVESIKYGMMAASFAATKRGVYVPKREQVDKFISE